MLHPLNGTFNIDRIVSSTEIEVAANTSGEAGTYDANSGQTQRVTETGQENENVVKDIDFNNVTGSSCPLTVDRYVVTCTVSGGRGLIQAE